MTLLGFVDILPRCVSSGGILSESKYERFDVLIKKANNWLASNPDKRVKTVESIEIKRKSLGEMNPNRAGYTTHGHLDMKYFRALRLWVVKRDVDDPPEPQRIAHFNVVPKSLGNGGLFSSRPKYESYRKTIERLNARLRNNPLQGRVINLETQDMKYHTGIGGVNPDETYWRESKHGKYFINILRIFYEVGPPRHEEIGFADFKPAMTEDGGILGKAHFESFRATVSHAARWIAQHPELNIVSVQSCDYKMKYNDAVDTHRTAYFEQGEAYTYFLRIIRVGYVFSTMPPSYGQGENESVNLTYKTFRPIRYSGNYETISQTVRRACEWIRQTGAHLISAETVPVRLDGGYQHGNPEVTYTRLAGSRKQVRWMYVVRCYFSNRYTEPHAAVHYRNTEQYDDCCTLL